MTLRSLALGLLFCACAEGPPPAATGFIENHSVTSPQLKGLQRDGVGPFLRGATEKLSTVTDSAVRDVRWSASAGKLTARENRVSWTLPDAESAELTVTLTANDGREVVTTFTFALVQRTTNVGTKSISEALLAAPMPVFDGGVNDVSGGACDLQYDTSANIHLAFTSSTHPALYYGKWDGATWAIEVVDALGFDLGGTITPSYVVLKVDTNGAPHLAYVRDGELWYATKSNGSWVRERVDNATQPFSGYYISLALNPLSSSPSIVFTNTGVTLSANHVVYATRTGPATWATTQVNFPVTLSTSRNYGDLLFDAAGVAYFTVSIDNPAPAVQYLASIAGTTVELRALYTGQPDHVRSMAWAGSGRLVMRTTAGVYDVMLASPLSNSTLTWSAIEVTGAGIGDIAWNGRPVVLHHHSGGAMELVTPAATGGAYWTWTQMGVSSGVSASVAVHPTTGVASICYQANSHIMFQ